MRAVSSKIEQSTDEMKQTSIGGEKRLHFLLGHGRRSTRDAEIERDRERESRRGFRVLVSTISQLKATGQGRVKLRQSECSISLMGRLDPIVGLILSCTLFPIS